MKSIFYRTSLLVMYEDISNFCTFFACIFDINNAYAYVRINGKHSANDRLRYKMLYYDNNETFYVDVFYGISFATT